MSQGQKANQNGKMFEDETWDYLEKNGHSPLEPPGHEAIWFGGTRLNKTDIFLPARNIQIECKFQAVSGTCDEKLPTTLLNASEKVKCDYYILLYGGPHWTEHKRGANIIRFLKKFAGELNASPHSDGAKKILVMDLDELKEWL